MSGGSPRKMDDAHVIPWISPESGKIFDTTAVMKEGIHYKEFFQLAKEKVVTSSLVVGLSSLAQIPMREGSIQ
ncbi:MAG TPA: hypothetical protein HPQ00_02455 [Magnetococcales bacterium]|nr:hypothetical protein [Magnetococcales bacterium]